MADNSRMVDARPTNASLSGEATIAAVVGCGKQKADKPTEAQNLYTSTYFTLKRNYADQFADHLWILSAEHGLIPGEKVIEPYDTHISDRSLEAGSAFIENSVATPLQSDAFQQSNTDVIIALTGSDYQTALERAAAYVVDLAPRWYPLQQEDLSGIGAQMGWLSDRIEAGEPVAHEEPHQPQKTLAGFTDQ